MNMKRIMATVLLVTSVFVLDSCDNNVDEQIVVTFGPDFYKSANESSSQAVPVNLNFSLPLYEDAQIKVGIKNNGAVYGTDYITNPPELVAGEIIVLAEVGATTASFSITPINNDEFTEGVTLNLSIEGLNGSLKSMTGQDLTFDIIDDDMPAFLAEFDFENCEGDYTIPTPFTEENVPGYKEDRGWGCRPYGLTGNGVQASAFGGDPGADNAWLLLKMSDVDLNAGGKLDISGLSALYLSIWVESFYDGSGTIDLKYSTDYPGSGNPEDYTWTIVDGFSNQLPPPGSGVANAPDGLFVPIFVSLGDIAGEQDAYIAFHYYGGSSSNSSSWTIDDLELYGE